MTAISGGGLSPLPEKNSIPNSKQGSVSETEDVKGFLPGDKELAKKMQGKLEQLSDLGKDGKISEKLKDLGKIGSVNKKIDLFDGNDLQDAKAAISDMMAGSGKDTISYFRFDTAVDNMSKKELTTLAKHINGLMQNTDGKDDMLGKLLGRVLSEIENRDNPRPPFDDGAVIMKYTCSYATKNLRI